MKQTTILTHATHVNGWEPVVYMSCMGQNCRLFHVSNLSVRNFRIFLLMYTGSVSAVVCWLAPGTSDAYLRGRIGFASLHSQRFIPGPILSADQLTRAALGVIDPSRITPLSYTYWL